MKIITAISCIFMMASIANVHAANPIRSFAFSTWKACSTDHKKFCSAVKSGEGRVIKCLSDHSRDISPVCRANISVISGANGALAMCMGDAAKHCSNVKEGSGRLLACFSKNIDKISPACLNSINKARNTLKY
ncbi:MAG: hypothetical protein COA52_04680 [Hyphomicrobiales bacterium]|nr:MAG: hypothetical protein COA52_04680 [Hyphomicrobiales bacterium]